MEHHRGLSRMLLNRSSGVPHGIMSFQGMERGDRGSIPGARRCLPQHVRYNSTPLQSYGTSLAREQGHVFPLGSQTRPSAINVAAHSSFDG
jgi:hypothetical protein